MPDIVEISKRPAYETVMKGDPWIFIREDPVYIWPDNAHAQVGEFITHWYGGRQYIFKITKIHHPWIYETVFTGEIA